jgi:hypothetical protein
MNAVFENHSEPQISKSIRVNPRHERAVLNANLILKDELGEYYPQVEASWDLRSRKEDEAFFNLTLKDDFSEVQCVYPLITLENEIALRRALNLQWRDLINDTVRRLRKRVDEAFQEQLGA